MRIAINCRSILLEKRTGIGRYTYHLLDSLGQIDSANEYLLHAPKRLFDFKRQLPSFTSYSNFKPRMDYFNQGAGHSDIYHLPSPDTIPTFSGKLVVTIHDLIYKTYPKAHTPQTIELTEKYMAEITKRADHFICISENTRRDLHQLFNIPDQKTGVIYNGVDQTVFYPLSLEERLYATQALRARGIDKPFVLFVGTMEPRKNISGLLQAFASVKAKKIFDGQLVVVGMQGWMVDNLEDYIEQLGISQDVVFLGYVSNEQLRELYGLTEVFVFPSFYEGFGFPIVEAFCCGAAVITSSTSSCGEIAGQAAMLIDPSDPPKIASAMEQVLTDETKKESLRQAGPLRAKDFSFQTTAQKTLEVYINLCKK